MERVAGNGGSCERTTSASQSEAADVPMHSGDRQSKYNKGMPIPPEIRGQKYISLATFRKSGEAIYTPVWFGEENDKLYVMTNGQSGKAKRIRNNGKVKVAACTIRGKITGPEFSAVARILPPEDGPRARKSINRKYWAARIPFLWRRTDTYFEIDVLP